MARHKDGGWFVLAKVIEGKCLIQDPRIGYLRTCIFSHTTNRVDVELGARLFRHLMALPIAYHG